MNRGTKEIVQLVKYLIRKHEVLSWILNAHIKMPGVLVGIRNPALGVGGVEVSGSQGSLVS